MEARTPVSRSSSLEGLPFNTRPRLELSRLEPADGDAGERPATPSSVSSSNSSFDRAAPSAQASLSRAGSAATQAESDVLLSRQNEELRAVLEAVTVEAESQKSISDITKQNLLQVMESLLTYSAQQHADAKRKAELLAQSQTDHAQIQQAHGEALARVSSQEDSLACIRTALAKAAANERIHQQRSQQLSASLDEERQARDRTESLLHERRGYQQQLEERLRGAHAAQQALRTRVQAGEAAQQRLQAQLDEAISAQQQLGADAEAARAQAIEAETQLQREQERCQQLQGRLEEAVGAYAGLQHSIEASAASLRPVEEELGAVQADSREQEYELEALRGRVQATQEAVAECRSCLGDRAHSVANALQSMQSLQGQIERRGRYSFTSLAIEARSNNVIDADSDSGGMPDAAPTVTASEHFSTGSQQRSKSGGRIKLTALVGVIATGIFAAGQMIANQH